MNVNYHCTTSKKKKRNLGWLNWELNAPHLPYSFRKAQTFGAGSSLGRTSSSCPLWPLGKHKISYVGFSCSPAGQADTYVIQPSSYYVPHSSQRIPFFLILLIYTQVFCDLIDPRKHGSDIRNEKSSTWLILQAGASRAIPLGSWTSRRIRLTRISWIWGSQVWGALDHHVSWRVFPF